MHLNGGKFVSALDSTFVNSQLKFTIVSVTFLNCEVSRNVYYKGDSINFYIFSYFIHFDKLLLQLRLIDF